MKQSQDSIIRGWINHNIYSYKKADSIMYFFFYIVIPITVTAISLYSFPEDTTSAIYCYITILISALNCWYDGANRWVTGQKSIINVKIFVMLLFVTIISVYCIVIILSILILQEVKFRVDGVLCFYFVTVVVALIDIACCVAKEMTLKTHVASQF